MAGIGFELKKLFKEDSYTKRFRAYLYSAIVAAGPWISTVVALNILNVFAKTHFDNILHRNLFMGSIIYSFIFSMIITVPFQFLITRYISDCLYKKEYKFIGASFIGLNKIILFITGLLGIVFYINKPLPIYYKFFSLLLFMVISSIWIVMVYLSTLKNYRVIIISFFTGCLVAVGLGYLLMKMPINFYTYKYPTNLLLAFLIGMIVILSILMVYFKKTFKINLYYQFSFLKYFPKFYKIFFAGLLYTLGIWIHNFIIWFSELGIIVNETYRFAPIYDSAVFWAYITIIPTLTLFVVNMETRFYIKYKKYYGLITNNASLTEIDKAKKEMQKSLHNELFYIMEIQIMITIFVIIVSKIIFSYYNFPIIFRDIFQITALGAFCNVFLLLIIMILLYFDAQNLAFFSSAIFIIGNSFWTYYFLPRGLNFYGFGYFMGALIAFLMAYFFILIYLKNITYFTFFSQPLFFKRKKNFFDKFIDSLTYYYIKMKRKMNYTYSYRYIFVLIIITIGAALLFKDSNLNKKYKTYREKLKKNYEEGEIEKPKGLEGREKRNY